MPATLDQRANAVAVGAKGNAIIAGGFQGTVDFRGTAGMQTSMGGFDAFVVKLSP